MKQSCDVIVIGAGHAGIEAALATARLNHHVFLFTINRENIGFMPCNPSIGGPAKGIVVREIDALGGEMGKAADATLLQIKVLNKSKGPGVWSLRSQNDKIAYAKYMQKVIANTPNIIIIEKEVKSLIIKDQIIIGVIDQFQIHYYAKIVILTSGTYLSSCTLKGNESKAEGPAGFKNSQGLSQALTALGFQLIRLKTGTPPRINKFSINFDNMIIEPGDQVPLAFAWQTKLTKKYVLFEKQINCHLIYTNATTHQIIKDNLHLSPIYGQGKSCLIGPRYCPSIEDKVVKFAHHNRHQIFLEPESLSLDTIYVQGFSTSMPETIQLKMLQSLPGLEKVEVMKYGYAIEYDVIIANQLYPTLETKLIKNLYTAGQINGTSGYEEAACQGLMAGINAHLNISKLPPFILRRDEAYIGVLIDDLNTKQILEPYRLLTSRAEYRVLLRNDNAEARLMKYGHQIGLINDHLWKTFQSYQTTQHDIIANCKKIIFQVTNEPFQIALAKISTRLTKPSSVYQLLTRPNITINFLKPWVNVFQYLDVQDEAALEIEIKFKGYVKKQFREAQKFLKTEAKQIPHQLNYDEVTNLSLEAVEKLKIFQPATIGQATRIAGVNLADVQMILVYLKKKYAKKNNH